MQDEESRRAAIQNAALMSFMVSSLLLVEPRVCFLMEDFRCSHVDTGADLRIRIPGTLGVLRA